MIEALPAPPLVATGEAGAAFLARGVRDFRAAARYLRDLPYGRNASRTDLGSVLREGRGTCSTKHALLANLAKELGIPLELRVGIFLMTGENMPRVGAVLAAHGVEGLPEAHCFVVYEGTRVDVTGLAGARSIDDFLVQETIAPADVGARKIALHRKFLASWLETHELGRRLSPDAAWAVREACIAALAG